jgi:hypothetical protein
MVDRSFRGIWFAETTPVRFAIYLAFWIVFALVGVGLAVVGATWGGVLSIVVGVGAFITGVGGGILQHRRERQKLAAGTWGRPRELGCGVFLGPPVLLFVVKVAPQPIPAALLGLAGGYLAAAPVHLVLMRRAYRRTR